MAATKSVFANLENIPTEFGVGKIYTAMAAVGKGVAFPSLKDVGRELKQKWKEGETMQVKEKGFTVFSSMDGNGQVESAGFGGSATVRTPPTYFKFTIGETPTYSFYFGDDAPYYHATSDSWEVAEIRIVWEKEVIILLKSNVTDAEKNFKIDKKGMVTSLCDIHGTHGWFFQDLSSFNLPSTLSSVAPLNTGTILLMKQSMEKNIEDGLSAAVELLQENGGGLYMWNPATAKSFVSEQSFTFSEKLDAKFLKKPQVDFKKSDKVDTKKNYISFELRIDQRNDTTDYYTGRNNTDPNDDILVCRIQFPGDEMGLAPMGTSDEGTSVACGLEGLQDRTIAEILPGFKNGVVEQVKIKFEDGSNCIFPDAEEGTFTATDKETGGMLKGMVEKLILADGKWKDHYATEKANRIERNIDKKWTLYDGDKPVTASIAWEEGNFLKVIVPTEKGAKLITIPTRGA